MCFVVDGDHVVAGILRRESYRGSCFVNGLAILLN